MSELREGTTTLLFTDVQGSTGLGARSGDDSARRILRRTDEIIRARVRDHGGHEVKGLGDGLMVAFSSARKAVSCAAAIQRDLEQSADVSSDELPPVRMGLNAGEVIAEDGDLFGSTVGAAARICDVAAGGEVLVSEVVKVLAGTVPEVAWQDRGQVTLKGFPEPCRLYRAEWRSETVPERAGLTPFVGRKKERAELRSWFDRLDQGRGGLVAIGGEPGVGKTRLAEELIREAEARGFRTVTGRCYEMDSPPPYGPFVEVLEAAAKEVDPTTFRMALGPAAGEIAKVLPHLRHAYDDIPPPLELPPQQERRYLFNSIGEFIERASALKPLVVLFDDVHWADEASLQLMEHIAPQLPDLPVLVVATYRDVELDVYRPLAKTLEDLLRRRLISRMSLTRLPEDGVGAMLTKLAGSSPPPSLTETIFRETEGNAFFVEEVFRHLDEEGRLRDSAGNWRADLRVEDLEVPEGVRLVIGRRLQRLAPATTKLMTCAAVIGRVFDFHLLEAVAGDDGGDELLDSLDEAQRSHVVMSRAEGRDAKVVFVHELIRQTLLGAIALPRRQRLHLRVAEAMEKVYAEDLPAHAAEIAHHLYRAGAAADPGKTQEYLSMAGDRAIEAAAFAEALKYFDEACELSASQSDVDRAALLFRVGLARRSLGQLDDGLTAWREALSLYEAAGDTASVAAVTPDIGLQLGWAARWPEALEMAGRGLAAIGDAVTGDRARLQAIAAIALGWAGDYDGAVQMIEAAVALVEELGDPLLLGEALTVQTAHHFAYSETLLGLETGERAMSLLRDTPGAWNYAAAVSFSAVTTYYAGDMDRAEALGDEAVSLGHSLGHFASLIFGDRTRTFVRLNRGEIGPAEFLAFAEKDFELCRSSGLPFEAYALCFRTNAQWGLGDLDGALASAEEAARTEPPSALWGYAQGLRFLVHAAAGPTERALELRADLLTMLPQTGRANSNGIWSTLLFLIEGSSFLGIEEEDSRLYDLVRELQLGGTAVRFDGQSLELFAALAAASCGRDDLARDHFEKALEDTARMGVKTSQLDTSLYYARMLAGRGRPEDAVRARELLDFAAAGYEAMGWVARVPTIEAVGRTLDGEPGP